MEGPVFVFLTAQIDRYRRSVSVHWPCMLKQAEFFMTLLSNTSVSLILKTWISYSNNIIKHLAPSLSNNSQHEFNLYYLKKLQGSAKRRFPGLVNSVTAVAYHFCLDLPAAFTQLGVHLLAEFCICLRPPSPQTISALIWFLAMKWHSRSVWR